ncbi:hypothetical protein [Leptospira bandrabouensis]|uniref:hypothetical protein n=1 Tax=Leptospira bandrabouensis TaxID=2484903 RepID=UPI001EE998B8|nr:hypothetical protein [Leptospira bandrabouensis]MCG6146537.1 hypothetical protein [Leptospira bandrabouensis]MCG6161910.1 hypothetical protein [Leptospira bandrabouensis]MCG6166125.1 hypothetical protein [Leptospira bandrabouensis]
MKILKLILIHSFFFISIFCNKKEEINKAEKKSYYYTIEKTQFFKSLKENDNIISEIDPETKIEIIRKLDSNNNSKWLYIKIANQIGFINGNSITRFSIPNNCSSFNDFLEENFKKIGNPKFFNSRKASHKNNLGEDYFLERTSQSYTEGTEHLKEEYYEGGSETLIVENITISEGLLIGIHCNELFSEIDFQFYKDNEKIEIQHPSGAFLWLSVKKVGKKTYIKYSSTS